MPAGGWRIRLAGLRACTPNTAQPASMQGRRGGEQRKWAALALPAQYLHPAIQPASQLGIPVHPASARLLLGHLGGHFDQSVPDAGRREAHGLVGAQLGHQAPVVGHQLLRPRHRPRHVAVAVKQGLNAVAALDIGGGRASAGACESQEEARAAWGAALRCDTVPCRRAFTRSGAWLPTRCSAWSAAASGGCAP